MLQIMDRVHKLSQTARNSNGEIILYILAHSNCDSFLYVHSYLILFSLYRIFFVLYLVCK